MYKDLQKQLFILNKEINKRLHPRENWWNEVLMKEAEELMEKRKNIELDLLFLDDEDEINFEFKKSYSKKIQKSKFKINLYDDDWRVSEFFKWVFWNYIINY